MTPEQGYEHAKRQTPGCKVVMGPTAARIAPVPPISNMEYYKLPGPCSYWEYTVIKEIGYIPSAWSKTCALVAMDLGHVMQIGEWNWLNEPSTGLKDVINWIDAIIKGKEGTE